MADQNKPTTASSGDRALWIDHASRMAEPVLHALANEQLRATMPVEISPLETLDRRNHTHLEAFGRLMAGIAPWIESNAPDPRRAEIATLANRALLHATDPKSPDFLNFCDGPQALVDSAFLAQALLRAPTQLWQPLDATTKANVVTALKSSRRIKPGQNNWLLFSATVEAFLAMAGEEWDAMRVDYALQQHEQWYKGDGAYGDGANFHFDYYNSFVIQPMSLDVLAEVTKHREDWNALYERVKIRSQRFAAVQERLIAPDGSYPAIGRSLAYRGGAFQSLAQIALQRRLPELVTPPQARTALTAVLKRTLEAPGVYDKAGWLRIGLCGHQPSIGERYISTGSLYLASTLFLPLGLPASDPFWSSPAEPFTGQRAWGGVDLPPDHAIHV